MRTSTTIILAGLVHTGRPRRGNTMTPQMSRAEEALIPKDMVYVGLGPSVIGLDKEEPADSGKTLIDPKNVELTELSRLIEDR